MFGATAAAVVVEVVVVVVVVAVVAGVRRWGRDVQFRGGMSEKRRRTRRSVLWLVLWHGGVKAAF